VLKRLLGLRGRNQPASDRLPFLIVGLGNPGREYREHRHNIGFMVIDRISEDLGIRISRVQSNALIGKGSMGEHNVILAKPQTFMNNSGRAVSSLVRFYKTPLEQLLVIYDDLDLPFGTLRVRPSGGSAGQKGMSSILQHLKSEEFPRLRVGIGRPPGRMDGSSYVLQKFPESETELLALTLKKASEAVQSFIQDGLNKTMSTYNGEV
jgi:PTH1 family peptidyl-tRNA hydrolase